VDAAASRKRLFVNVIAAPSSLRARVGAAIGGAAAILALSCLPAAALTPPNENPMPHLRPQGAAPQQQGQQQAQPNAPAKVVRAPAQAFNPNLPFNPQEQAALGGINAYLNSFQLMEGKFIQISPDGRQAEGIFFINRPGRVRFHYNPPSQLDITASNGSVAVRDRRLGTQDLYPLSKTPLRYLLAESINLFQPGLVDGVTIDNDQISVVIVEKSNLVSGQIRMTFDAANFQLLRWVVTDAAGDTSFGIFDTVTGKPQDPALFRISVN
jgi:outer membrane lipoprotein-sorting protein